MIPRIDIPSGAVTETDAPWPNADGSAAPSSKATYLLLGLALLAAALVFASTSDTVSRLMDRIAAAWTAQPESKAAARSKAIAKLIAETDSQDNVPAVEGADAITRNELLPVSGLPVEASRPFVIPAAAQTQVGKAQQCLTQAIYYEAATESDAGKAAVAQVILNRMRHPAFPNTVCGVVYQGSSRPGCQFSFACDGSLLRAPVAAIWRRSAEIARAALSGHVEASVGMATHYHANYVFPRWAPKLTKIEQIGVHIFYRWPGTWGKPGAFTSGYSGAEWIPAISQLYNMNAVHGDMPADEGLIPAGVAVRDPTDRRADNDVGGRIDTTKGWTPSIPDPTQGKSQLDALLNQQGAASGPEPQKTS